jgi:TonB family protein
MKKNFYSLVYLIVAFGVICAVHAQTKNIPSPDTDIPHDKEPVVVNQVNPIYPASMLSSGWEATVYVKAFIDVNGNVEDVRYKRLAVSSDKPYQEGEEKAFEDAAYTAIKQWKFSPAQLQGKPVAAWVTVPFHFKLSGEREDTSQKELEGSIQPIKDTIKKFLKGRDLEKIKDCIEMTAPLVYNAKMVSLLAVLRGLHKDVQLVEGEETKITYRVFKITDKNDSAILVWKIQRANGELSRIHTIIIAKDKKKNWKIVHWHVGF